jgi:putative DNA primase/helicase
LEQGDDPGELRKIAKAKAAHEAVNTFKAVAEDWLAHQAGRWEAITLARTRASLVADVYPAFGRLPMANVTTRQVMDVVKAIEKRGAGEVAMRVLQRIKSVFRYAVTHQRIEQNPMLDLVPSEILKARRVRHRPALAAAELPAFQSENQIENTFRVHGELAAWRDRVAARCAGNSRLVFAVACAFAGPLLKPASVESGGFHLRGASSSGKTTALRVAASVFGWPSYMQRWRTTDNALEPTAAQHCDALLTLDELAQVDGKVAGECAYMLANEQSKGRSTRNAAARPRLRWRLLFLSSGELGLADHMAEGMKRARTGQEVRMADIPADAGAGLGAFEDIHEFEGGSAFASHLSRESARCYGTAGRAWLAWACEHTAGLGKRVRNAAADLAREWVPHGASGQVAARFALVAVAGALATEAGLTGWASGESENAARTCFDAWLQARGGVGNGETIAMLRQVRRFLETNGEGRFTWWHRGADDHNAKTLARAGFRRMLGKDGSPIKSNSEHQREYGARMEPLDGESVSSEFFVLAEVFRAEVCQGFDYQAVCRVLLEHGCLLPDKGRTFDCKPRLPGLGPTTCYRISSKLMALEL